VQLRSEFLAQFVQSELSLACLDRHRSPWCECLTVWQSDLSELSERLGRLLPPIDVRSRSGIVGGAKMRIRQYKSGRQPLHLEKITSQPSHELFSSSLGSLQVMVEVDEYE
jgi:hypothetical protein